MKLFSLIASLVLVGSVGRAEKPPVLVDLQVVKSIIEVIKSSGSEKEKTEQINNLLVKMAEQKGANSYCHLVAENFKDAAHAAAGIVASCHKNSAFKDVSVSVAQASLDEITSEQEFQQGLSQGLPFGFIGF